MPILLGGSTWYVATTGNDANDCATTSTPCATINGAIGKAASGDTIYVAQGTYTGSSANITKGLVVSGGWNSSFTSQTSYSIVDGENTRDGISINSLGDVKIS